MRYLKKLLICVYAYMGAVGLAAFVAWAATGEEPMALIGGVFGAAGVESIIAGIMRIHEMHAEADARREERAERAREEKYEKNDY